MRPDAVHSKADIFRGNYLGDFDAADSNKRRNRHPDNSQTDMRRKEKTTIEARSGLLLIRTASRKKHGDVILECVGKAKRRGALDSLQFFFVAFAPWREIYNMNR